MGCLATAIESKVTNMFALNPRAQLWECEQVTPQREKKVLGESRASFCWDCFVLNLVNNIWLYIN